MSRNTPDCKKNVDIQYIVDVAKIVQSLAVAITILAGLGIHGGKVECLNQQMEVHCLINDNSAPPSAPPSMTENAKTSISPQMPAQTS